MTRPLVLVDAAPTIEQQRELLRIFAGIEKPWGDQIKNPRCCIAATRIVLDVFAYARIEGVPLVVKAMLLNRQWVELVERLGRYPVASEYGGPDGVWSIGVGAPPGPDDPPDPPHTWSGHLVPLLHLVDGSHWLVDASLDQGNRPEYDIEVPPVLLAQATPEFLAGDRLVLRNDAGATCMYEHNPEAPSWRHAPDWANRYRYIPTTARLVRALRKEAPWYPWPS